VTYEQANRILDRTREGWQFSEFVINRALELTGDYEPNGGSGMDKEVQEKNEGRREKGSVLLVANNSGRHNQETGPESGRRIARTNERTEGTK
jgi:hypothetical protein